MGYHTDFTGSLMIDPPLNDDEISYLTDFAESRRYIRGTAVGPLVVTPADDWGVHDPAAGVDYNRPPAGQPGLWCAFRPNEDGTEIVWDESEKTYDGETWIAFLVARLLAPVARPYLDAHLDDDPRLASFTADHVVEGRFHAEGEESDDRWGIDVDNNVVTRWDAVIEPGPKRVVRLP